jgi:hypothetical protein
LLVVVVLLLLLLLRCHLKVPHNSIEKAERSHQAIITKEEKIH